MSAASPDIFISYAREDVEWVRPLAAELERRGWRVFWDQRIPAGKSWRNHIGVRLEAARCVIVVWSESALKSRFVLQEADIGLEREVLLPVLRQPVRPPLGFREIHAANLAEWRPGEPSAEFETFVVDLADLLVSSRQPELVPDEPEPGQPASLEPSGHAAEPLAEPSEPIISAAKDIDGRQTIAPLADAMGPPASDASPPAPRPEMRRSDPVDDSPVREPLTPPERLQRVEPAPAFASAGVRATVPSPPAPKRSLWPAIALGLLAVVAVGGGVYLAGRSPSNPAKVEVARPPPAEPAAPVQSEAPGQEKAPAPLVRSPVQLVAPAAPIVAAKPSRRPGDTFTDSLKDGSPCPFCPELVVVPAGSFTMGSTPEERKWAVDQGGKAEWYAPEQPAHQVTIAADFALGRTEVTRGQFARFVDATKRNMSGGCRTWTGSEWKLDADKSWRNPGFDQSDDHPAVCISWEDAGAYAEWISQQTGEVYRLPSETQWEYATRAGTSAMRYWGDDKDNKNACDFANVADRSFKTKLNLEPIFDCDDHFAFTSPVSGYKPNDFNLFDTLGSIREWNLDCYHDSYQGAPSNEAAWITGDCPERVLRGGSWFTGPRNLRSAYRFRYAPDDRGDNLGFRVARMLTP